MRTLSIAIIVLCATALAHAGMTPDQMRARLKEIEAELGVIGKGPFVHTTDSVQADMRDLDRRKFENDLDLARVNARREVLLVYAKSEHEQRHAGNSELGKKLDDLRKQRSALQRKLEDTTSSGDEGANGPLDVRLAVVKLDQDIASLEYQILGSGSRLSDLLADLEIELAGINAVCKALDLRAGDLNRRYEQVADIEGRTRKLRDEQQMLIRELMERGLATE